MTWYSLVGWMARQAALPQERAKKTNREHRASPIAGTGCDWWRAARTSRFQLPDPAVRFRSIPAPMTGTFLNAAMLLTGIVLVRMGVSAPPANVALRLRWPLAGAALFAGGEPLVRHLETCTGPQALRLLALTLVSLVLGNLVGRGLGLQRRLAVWGTCLTQRLPRVGEISADRRTAPVESSASGWFGLGILLALNPLTIPSSVLDGLDNRILGLSLKTILDLLALASFGRRLPIAGGLWVLAVQFIWQGLWSGGSLAIAPLLQRSAIANAVSMEAGILMVCAVPALAGIRKAHLADLLPSLPMAAFLAWLWKG